MSAKQLFGNAAAAVLTAAMLGFAAAPAKSAPTSASAPAKTSALNQQAIHIAYNEGDFDKVVTEIESFTKVNKTYSRADSIFIAKHLSVVYTANPNTREKGKYYMYRLLEMMPSAELVDMFVSDEIDRIFEKVRKEFVARQSSFGVDTTQIALPDKAANPRASAPAGATATAAKPAPAGATANVAEDQPETGAVPLWKRKGFWIASGAGVAVAGAIITYVSMQQPSSSGKVYVISSGSN